MIKSTEFITTASREELIIDFLLTEAIEKELSKIIDLNKEGINFLAGLACSAKGFIENNILSNIETIYQTDTASIYKFKSTQKLYIDIYCFNREFSRLAEYMFEKNATNPNFNFKQNYKTINFKIEHNGITFIDTVLKFVSFGQGINSLVITLAEV